jgi:hypothetical protein
MNGLEVSMVPTSGRVLAVCGCRLTVRVFGDALDVYEADGDRIGHRQVEAILEACE